MNPREKKSTEKIFGFYKHYKTQMHRKDSLNCKTNKTKVTTGNCVTELKKTFIKVHEKLISSSCLYKNLHKLEFFFHIT